MGYPWYEELSNSKDISQGDIINGCAIPIPNISLYNAILENTETVEDPIDIKISDLIVVSQACDIANDKINTLVLCSIWPLSRLIKDNSYYSSSKARESLRQGKEPSYHLVTEYKSGTISRDYSVVDFHNIYTLPKNFIIKTVENIPSRLRLLPPYREHLSQAFARYFMRVGLPQDILRNKIKEYKTE